MHRSGRRFAAVVGVGLFLLGLTGCYDHDEFVVVEPPSSPVSFRHLADEGRFTVVEASGAGTVVPAAGWWRVDRDSGATVALPGAASRISADGSRVLLADGRLWHEGGAVDPAGGVYSNDLRFRLAVDAGVLTVHPVLGGPPVDVDAEVPRPAGVTSVTPLAVSEDGRSVSYRMNGGTGPGLRFVRLGFAPLDFVEVSGSEAMLSGDGLTVARSVNTYGTIDQSAQAQIDVFDLPTGTVVASQTRQLPDYTGGLDWSESSSFDLLAISDRGRQVWGVEVRIHTSKVVCGTGPQVPILIRCQVAATLTTFGTDGTSTDVNYGNVVRSIDLTPNGHFALVSGQHPISAISGQVLHVAPILVNTRNGVVERLTQGEEETTSDGFLCTHYETPSSAPCTIRLHGRDAQMTDDGRLVLARSMRGAGIYEYRDDGIDN